MSGPSAEGPVPPDAGGIVAFLRARLDEDEAAAKVATAGPWRHNPDKHWHKPGTTWFEEAVFAGPAGKDATCIAGTGASDDPQSMRDAEHIARHDPARVLREVEAKRRIVDLHVIAGPDQWNPRYCVICGPTMGLAACRTVLAISIPFEDHPDYREDWRP